MYLAVRGFEKVARSVCLSLGKGSVQTLACVGNAAKVLYQVVGRVYHWQRRHSAGAGTGEAVW